MTKWNQSQDHITSLTQDHTRINKVFKEGGATENLRGLTVKEGCLQFLNIGHYNINNKFFKKALKKQLFGSY